MNKTAASNKQIDKRGGSMLRLKLRTKSAVNGITQNVPLQFSPLNFQRNALINRFLCNLNVGYKIELRLKRKLTFLLAFFIAIKLFLIGAKQCCEKCDECYASLRLQGVFN